MNAYAERFVLSAKPECLAKVIPLGERHLRKTVQSDEVHQQGLGNDLIEKPIGCPDRDGAVERRERLGGLLNYCYRRAA